MTLDGDPHGVTLAARPESARVARRRVRAWLESMNWPDGLADDVVYAVNEAVSNAVEHAYGPGPATGTVELTCRVEHGFDGARRLRIRVSDRGRWRAPLRAAGSRGRGLPLMRALMDEVVVAPGEADRGGTVVELLSPPATVRR